MLQTYLLFIVISKTGTGLHESKAHRSSLTKE